MKASDLACAVSARASDAFASWWAIPAYVGASVTAGLVLPETTVTLALSHFANLALLLLAAEQNRQARKMEAELDSVADAVPGAERA